MANAPSQPGLADRAALLALMTLVHEVSNTELRAAYGFTIDGQSRLRLEKQGYVTSRRDKGLPGRPYVHELTDQGWRWCREELSSGAPANSMKGYRLLYGVLNCVDRLMSRSGLSMDEVFTAGEKTPSAAATAQDQSPRDVDRRVREAYADLAKHPGSPVLLRLIRQRLDDVPRADVDAALARLVLEPGVFLEPESKQRMLSDADWDAAITLGGEVRHLLTIGRS